MTATSASVEDDHVRLDVLDVGEPRRTVRLAPRVEALGYCRYWISEHHGEGAITNPTLMVPIVAGLTKTMRVGTAGVLLRFQSALAVAESFRVLGQLFPWRIELGLARAGTVAGIAAALADGRPEAYSEADHAAKAAEVQRLLCGRLPADHALAAHPIDPPVATSGPPPLWIHSTSVAGARLAADLGSHYAFHDHFGHRVGASCVQEYVERFQPSPELSAPSAAVCLAGYCGDSDTDAHEVNARHFSKLPVDRRSVVGTMSLWRDRLGELVLAYRTRRIIVQTLQGPYDLNRQVESFARVAEVARTL